MAKQLIVEPTGKWEGNDGSYSTFTLRIGTPPQAYRVLPSVSGSEIWVPKFPDACSLLAADTNACEQSRGSQPGASAVDQSESWHFQDLWTLSSGTSPFNDGANATYGLESVELDTKSGMFTSNVSQQLIAAYLTPDFWLGVIGLGIRPTQLSSQDHFASLLSHLKEVGQIVSASFGYTAGRSYRKSLVTVLRRQLTCEVVHAPGILTLGAYDIGLISSGALMVPINRTNLELRASLQRVTVTNSRLGLARSLATSSNSTFLIDSTTSQLWLPTDLCEDLSQAFGLEYDQTFNYYTISSSVHLDLIGRNASMSLALAAADNPAESTIVTLKYEALATNLSAIPYNESTQLYFPIRRASDENQYVLGRVLLQEAYLAVDWETFNFTIGPAVPPRQLELLNTSPGTGQGSLSSIPDSRSPTSKALIGGIVAALVVLLIAVATLGYWFWRRRLSQLAPNQSQQPPEVPVSPKDMEVEAEKYRRATVGSQEVPEGYGTLPRYEPPPAPPVEMFASHGEAMLMSNEIVEMEGEGVPGELRSAEDIRRSSEAAKQKSTTVTVREVT
ncbi:Candidapepsin-2 [Pseudocercospora fuligena]|uniref:Candidapepsin-2 n=1 Tax=Pseudocercospora fuligena TaxID=685502 RepID=A0A8H6VM14_9PEZI|nr:Candidapepsin-2 [Pseudocercospora fuligena]